MVHESKNSFIDTLEDFFKKAPALPTNGREGIVKITPALCLIFGILGIIVAVAGLGVFTFLAPFAAIGGAHEVSSLGSGYITVLFSLVAAVFLLAAYPGTKARKASGWKMLFWSEVVNIISSLVAGAIVSAIIGALIGFYLLFQIKSYYK